MHRRLPDSRQQHRQNLSAFQADIRTEQFHDKPHEHLSRPAAAVALAFAQLAATAAQATDYNVGPIQITAPWARATPKGASTGAAYMTITNTGKTPDKVSCVSSDASAECQIHTMTMDNGVMQMRPVEGGLEIKPGETVTLKPGGLHVMLVNLKHPLEQGKHGEGDAEVRHRRLGGCRLSDRRHRRRRARRSRRRRHHEMQGGGGGGGMQMNKP